MAVASYVQNRPYNNGHGNGDDNGNEVKTLVSNGNGSERYTPRRPKIFDELSQRLFEAPSLALVASEEWGIDARILYKAAKALGVDEVNMEIRDVLDDFNSHRVDFPGKYLRKVLENKLKKR